MDRSRFEDGVLVLAEDSLLDHDTHCNQQKDKANKEDDSANVLLHTALVYPSMSVLCGKKCTNIR